MANWRILSGQLLKGEATLDKRKNCKQRIVDLQHNSTLKTTLSNDTVPK